MTVKENLGMRLFGLFIFFAPKHGGDFLADVVIRTNTKIRAEMKARS